uniref:RING-type domain-containing protein n=1 Tax=Strigamia maritima TaxID=126957 RepID=T1IIW6_STRMM
MWVKLLLLLAYLLALFFVSRLLEAAAWYEAGLLPYRILDPFSLSVRKLKRLLETRGMSYAGLVEKQELTTLVQSSGDITEGELAESESDESGHQASPTTHFSGGSHFYEEVEDTKDSVWLVQVIPPTGSPLLTDVIWRKLKSRLSPFGVRMGIFDCMVDQRLCKRKGWNGPQLILAMPKGHRAKDNVVLHAYPFRVPVRVEPIISWLCKHLMSRVHQVKSVDEVQSDWLQYDTRSSKSEVRVLLFSVLLDPPLFLLALGVKFSGRIRVGMMQVKDKDKSKELQEMGVTKTPTYLVITPERIFVYGHRIGEYLSYRRMEFFLKTLRPEVNDVFVLSLIIVNLIGSLNLLFVRTPVWRHLIFCFWRLAKANFILFLLWLILLALLSFRFMDVLSELGLKLVRLVSSSDVAVVLRNEWQKWRSCTLGLGATFFAFCWFFSWLWARWRPQDVSSANTSRLTTEWWSLDTYIMDCFFRPMASLTQPLTPSDLDLEEGMELLIERLAVPNLWLQPVISTDYIKDLPIWNYFATSTSQENLAKDSNCSESDVKSSEDEEGSLCIGCVSMQTECALPKSSCTCNSGVKRECSRRRGRIEMLPPDGMLPCQECAICLDVYKDGVVICGLPCGHNYHEHCILLWLSRDNHHCPVCRWPSYKPKTRAKLDFKSN